MTHVKRILAGLVVWLAIGAILVSIFYYPEVIVGFPALVVFIAGAYIMGQDIAG